jgi:hypothetical protein
MIGTAEPTHGENDLRKTAGRPIERFVCVVHTIHTALRTDITSII